MRRSNLSASEQAMRQDDEAYLRDVERARAIALDVFGGNPADLSRDVVLGVLDAVSERAGGIEDDHPEVEVVVGELKEALILAMELAGGKVGVSPAVAFAVYDTTFGAFESGSQREKLVLSEVGCLREHWAESARISSELFGAMHTDLLGLAVYDLTWGSWEDARDVAESIAELRRAAEVAERAFGRDGRSPEAVLDMWDRLFGGEDDE